MRAPKFLPIFTVEAMALLEAISMIHTNYIKSCTIFSDSKSVSNLSTYEISGKASYIIYKIKHELLSLRKSGYEIKLVWIPAHKGIQGNEIADQKAKEAIKLGIDTQIGIPFKDFKLKWKEQLFADFIDWCRKSSENRGSFYFKN